MAPIKQLVHSDLALGSVYLCPSTGATEVPRDHDMNRSQIRYVRSHRQHTAYNRASKYTRTL